MRLPAVLVVTVAVVAAFAAIAQSRPPVRVVALPKVRVTSSAIEFHGQRALLVRSIVVSRTAGVHLHINCGRCRRYPTKIRETHPRRGVKRFSGVNWIVVSGRSIRVVVTRKGKLGRFLVLGVGGKVSERHSLVYKASGCLNARQKRVPCPHHSKHPPKGVVPGGSTAGELRPNGIWQLFGSYNGAPQLGFIETGGESVEVHWDNLTGGAYTRAGDYSSDFVAGEAKNGILQLFGSANGAPELGFIKTSNTGSGMVEVQWDVLEGGSYKRAGSFASDFSAGDAKNGTWQLFGSANGAPELGFVKTAGLAGPVEVHWDVLNGSAYTRSGDFLSDFSSTGAGEQVWQLVDTGAAPQLGIIVTSKSGSGTVEPHWDNLNGSTYTRAGDFISDFSLRDGANGTWQLFGSGGGAPQLGFVKTSDTASGMVEVQWDVLSGSAYARAGAYTSDFSLGDVTTSVLAR